MSYPPPESMDRLRGEELRMSLLGLGVEGGAANVDSAIGARARKRTSTAPAVTLGDGRYAYTDRHPSSQIQNERFPERIYNPDLESPLFFSNLPTSQSSFSLLSAYSQPGRSIPITTPAPFPSSTENASPDRPPFGHIDSSPSLGNRLRQGGRPNTPTRRHSLHGPTPESVVRAPMRLKRKPVPRLNSRDGAELRVEDGDGGGGSSRGFGASSSSSSSSRAVSTVGDRSLLSGSTITNNSGMISSGSTGTNPSISASLSTSNMTTSTSINALSESTSSSSLWSGNGLGTPTMGQPVVRGFGGGVGGGNYAFGSPDVFGGSQNGMDEEHLGRGYGFGGGSFGRGGMVSPPPGTDASLRGNERLPTSVKMVRSGPTWNLHQLESSRNLHQFQNPDGSRSITPLLSPTTLTSPPIRNQTPSPNGSNSSSTAFKLTPPPPPHPDMICGAQTGCDQPGSPSPAKTKEEHDDERELVSSSKWRSRPSSLVFAETPTKKSRDDSRGKNQDLEREQEQEREFSPPTSAAAASFEGESFCALQRDSPGMSSAGGGTSDGYFQLRKGSHGSGMAAGSPLAKYTRHGSQDLGDITVAQSAGVAGGIFTPGGTLMSQLSPEKAAFMASLQSINEKAAAPTGMMGSSQIQAMAALSTAQGAQPMGNKAMSFAKSLKSKLSRENLGEGMGLRGKASRENLAGLVGARSMTTKENLPAPGRGLRSMASRDKLSGTDLKKKQSKENLLKSGQIKSMIGAPMPQLHRRARSVTDANEAQGHSQEKENHQAGVRTAQLQQPASTKPELPESYWSYKIAQLESQSPRMFNARDADVSLPHLSTPPKQVGPVQVTPWDSAPARLTRRDSASMPPSPIRTAFAQDQFAMTKIESPSAKSVASFRLPFSPSSAIVKHRPLASASKRTSFNTPTSLHALAALPGRRGSNDADSESSYSSEEGSGQKPVEHARAGNLKRFGSVEAFRVQDLEPGKSPADRKSFRPMIENRPSTSGSANSLAVKVTFGGAKGTKYPGQDSKRLSVSMTPGNRASQDSTLLVGSSSLNTLEGFEISAETLQEQAEAAAQATAIAEFKAAPPAFHFPSPPPSERPLSSMSMQDRAQAVMLRFPSPPPGGPEPGNSDGTDTRAVSRRLADRTVSRAQHHSMMSLVEEDLQDGCAISSSGSLTAAALAAHNAGGNQGRRSPTFAGQGYAKDEIDMLAEPDDAVGDLEDPLTSGRTRGTAYELADPLTGRTDPSPIAAQPSLKLGTPKTRTAPPPGTPERLTQRTPQIAIESPHGTRYRNASAPLDSVSSQTVLMSATVLSDIQSLTGGSEQGSSAIAPKSFSAYDGSPELQHTTSFSPRSHPMQSPLQPGRAYYKPISPLSIITKGEDMRLRPLQQMTDDGMLSANSQTSFGLSVSTPSSMGDELSERFAVSETWMDVMCGCWKRAR